MQKVLEIQLLVRRIIYVAFIKPFVKLIDFDSLHYYGGTKKVRRSAILKLANLEFGNSGFESIAINQSL